MSFEIILIVVLVVSSILQIFMMFVVVAALNGNQQSSSVGMWDNIFESVLSYFAVKTLEGTGMGAAKIIKAALKKFKDIKIDLEDVPK